MKKLNKQAILKNELSLEDLIHKTTFKSLYAAFNALENCEYKQKILKALNMKRSFNL